MCQNESVYDMDLYNICIESVDYFTDSVCTCMVSIFQTTWVLLPDLWQQIMREDDYERSDRYTHY